MQDETGYMDIHAAETLLFLHDKPLSSINFCKRQLVTNYCLYYPHATNEISGPGQDVLYDPMKVPSQYTWRVANLAGRSGGL
jgi:hypothetical protein